VALGPERFLQEIKIAANLHHPHILPLYDSGEAEGFLYYVMPYVEGESLRDRLEREKQLAIDDALQVAREVADALSYAHSHGVSNRDIKPENILLESGHAVVADFGIARAVDAAGGERLTETGIAIGTPAYMSPEQAGGEKDLDGRSDLYSLGCVLHEMLAGQPPFTGPTVESLVHQHLSAPPPDVTTIRPSVPGWVATALERSLAKTPADRFNPVALFGEAISPRASVAADTRPIPAPEMRRWLVPTSAAAVLVVMTALVLFRMMGPQPITITTSNHHQVTMERGLEFQPALSPDGKDVAFVTGPIGTPRIAVRSAVDIGSGETRLGLGLGGTHWLPHWTPDSASVRFWVCLGAHETELGSDCEWKEQGAHGGAVRTFGVRSLSDIHHFAWSRDGTRMAFAVGDSIFAYAADQTEPVLLDVHTENRWPLHSLAWSPDGRRIAYVKGNYIWRESLNQMSVAIWVVDANGGASVQVTDEESMNVSPQWLPDSRHLLFVSNRDGARGIYVVEVGTDGPRGPPRSVLPSCDAHSISVTADGKKLAYARFPAAQNIWSIPIPREGVVSIREAIPVTEGNQLIESHTLSPDRDSIVYESARRGNFDLYRQPVTGGEEVPIVDLPGDAFAPQWSPDGSEIAFYSADTDGSGAIFVVPAGGGGVPILIEGPPGSDTDPSWSPDGLSIAFIAWGEAHTQRVWLVSRDRIGGAWGAPAQVTDFFCARPVLWHPDGIGPICRLSDSTGTFDTDTLVHVSRDGEVLARYAGMPLGVSAAVSPDGSRLYVAGALNGSRGVWWLPVGGGDLTKVIAFDDPSLTVPWDAFSVGDEHIYLTIARYESDIHMMDLEW
jgi:serine/threonine-protein kinase